LIRKIKIQIGIVALAFFMALAALVSPPLPQLQAAQQDQQNQQPQQNQQDQQNQPTRDQTQTDQQQPDKKKGGRFSGLKKITSGQSASETTSTASGGSKGISDGKKIGEMTPTAADRQQVTDMENYSVPQNDLKKFQDDGHLQPKQ
jgi:hypothetical protein